MSLERSPEMPDVPTVLEKAKTDSVRNVVKLIVSRQLVARPFAAPPGVPEDRKVALRTAFDAPAALMAQIEAFAKRTHPCTDGRASERVLAAAEDLLDGRLGKLAPKPRNLLRKLQGRLHYRRWLSQSMWA
jgi:hypothetical protein